MNRDAGEQWGHFKKVHLFDESLGFALDISRMGMGEGFFQSMDPAMKCALEDMHALEGGAIANPDEGRRVGHYWLRAPELAPDPADRAAIENTLEAIVGFAEGVHAGRLAPPGGGRFQCVLSLGIGGSALGPQMVGRALAPTEAGIPVHFLDNTDPDGIDIVLREIGEDLGRTLVLVISKSGSTAETNNAAIEVRRAFQEAGLSLAPQAVAVTGMDSKLDRLAAEEGWLARFPMWDWVGGRTSELSAVGLLPAALQGIPIREMLDGAAAMDELTRRKVVPRNPAALLALAWFHAGGGRGEKAMVVLPYKDRLDLLARYLQQLVMESLGKELDLDGQVVHQGLTVYGNKGSTDQHAFVQQLREGMADFFVTFVEVLKDRAGPPFDVAPGVTAGDYLSGFLQGTRAALSEAGRPSLTITLEEVSPRSVGALIALFERAVGLYASLVHVNAYHQPGVEAGKKVAAAVLTLQGKILATLQESGSAMSVDEVAGASEGNPEQVFLILRHLQSNRTEIEMSGEDSLPFNRRFRWKV